MLFVLGIFISEAQNLSKDSISHEFRYFVRLLEETHPDPYTEFGGKVQFHKQAFDIQQQLKSKEYTLEEYSFLILKFLSTLHDGHTYLKQTNKADNSVKFLPLSFRVIPEGLIVDKISTQNKEFLGNKILSINDIPIDTLCKNLTQFVPCENKYGAYNAFNSLTNRNRHIFQKLIPNLKDQVKLSVLSIDNKIKDINIDLIEDSNWNSSNEYVTTPKAEDVKHLNYKYIENKNTMYLKVSTIMSQECFQYMKDNNWPTLNNFLENFYTHILDKKLPEDTAIAIKQIPNFSEIFRNMLEEMRDNQSSNLIIDLRGNGGGFTGITLPSLYMLYGDKYLNTEMNCNYYRLISPLLMKKNGTTLDEYNKKYNSNYQYGDYNFPASTETDKAPEQKRKEFIAEIMGNAAIYIKDVNEKPVYTPKKVYVLTDAKTFSAAFHYAFYLWKMGAVIVGVPSRQTPNTYMEVTEFELPYTKIKGSISNSIQYYLPITDKRSKIFWPDMMPEYEDYKKHNFSQNSELFWLLDRINNK